MIFLRVSYFIIDDVFNINNYKIIHTLQSSRQTSNKNLMLFCWHSENNNINFDEIIKIRLNFYE